MVQLIGYYIIFDNAAYPTLNNDLVKKHIPIYYSLNAAGLNFDTFTSFFDLPENSIHIIPLSLSEGKTLFDRGLIPINHDGTLIVCTIWKAFALFINEGKIYESVCGNFGTKQKWSDWY